MTAMRRWEFLALVGDAAQRRLRHVCVMRGRGFSPALLARADEAIG
jgi:hypothetical protein